jgi:hypothetical protein
MEGESSAPLEARPDRIRGLGFDPRHLTPSEQREILELNARFAKSSVRVADDDVRGGDSGRFAAPPRDSNSDDRATSADPSSG